MRGLENKVSVVTGGGSGIGAAICLRLAEEGGSVAIFDIDKEGAARTAKIIEKSNGTAKVFSVDITDLAAVEAAVKDVELRLGPIAVLVNNVGWDKMMPFVETTPEFWRKLVDVNLIGHLNMHQAVLPLMAQRRSGKIINMSSDAGRVGSMGESVYSACKGGMIAFSKSIAREHARDGICVNVVCPGPTDTPLLHALTSEFSAGDKFVERMVKGIPLKRLGKSEEVAPMVAFLASSDADYITGQTISVSGGMSMHG